MAKVKKEKINKTINFMNFAYYFNQEQLEEVIDSTTDPNHLKTKFIGIIKNGNTTQAFLTWFMFLTENNKKRVLKKINKIYKHKNA